MRGLVHTLVLILSILAAPLQAFEVEEALTLPAPDGQQAELAILSTIDSAVFGAVVAAWQADHPTVTVRYTVASTTEVFKAMQQDVARFDLVLSSAMDLQMKLANDGFARTYRSAATDGLPAWAQWRNQLFAVAQEPVVVLLADRAFDGLELPTTRADLILLLRDNPDRFTGRIGTYDPTRSGAGYLFATQDARQSDSFWRLSEVMGSLSPRLYGGTAEMIADMQAGRLVVAYNVLGSYAASALPPDGGIRIVEFQDFTHVLLRTALIPRQADAPELGGAFLDFLLTPRGQQLLETAAGLPRISETAIAAGPHLRPIRIDPGLLVFVDPLNRQQFLSEWRAAVERR